MAHGRLSVLAWGMTEQRFSRSQRSAAVQWTPPHPNPAGIPVHWHEGEVMTIVIRPFLQSAALDFIPALKPGRCQEYSALLMLRLEARKFPTSRQERRAS
jgi:hypothetical protein